MKIGMLGAGLIGGTLGTLLMGQLAYEGDAGPEIAYRFERF